MEELQKEINGKLVVWCSGMLDDLTLEGILIWPPNGDSLSLKPYGYDPEELYLNFHMHRDDSLAHINESRWTLEYFYRAEFCFASVKMMSSGTPDKRQFINAVAELSSGDIFKLSDLTPNSKNAGATCAYA